MLTETTHEIADMFDGAIFDITSSASASCVPEPSREGGGGGSGVRPSILTPPTEVIITVDVAVTAVLRARGVGGVEGGVPDVDGVGGGAAGGRGLAAVVSPSVTLGIAAVPHSSVPAALPPSFLPPGLGSSD